MYFLFVIVESYCVICEALKASKSFPEPYNILSRQNKVILINGLGFYLLLGFFVANVFVDRVLSAQWTVFFVYGLVFVLWFRFVPKL
jgi:hypothetical protein